MTPPPSLQQLIETVRADSPGPEPLQHLEVAARTAADLESTSDALLGHFVDQCRRNGHSWTEISAALGVTRQAAHKRFNLTSASMERFTERAKNAIAHSISAARALGHSYVGTEHMLLSLFEDSQSLAAQVLAKLGASREDWAAWLRENFPPSPTPPSDDPPFTPRAAEALAGTMSEALALGHNYVGTEHILLALYRDQDSVAAKMLNNAGIIRQAVAAQITEALAGYTKPKPK